MVALFPFQPQEGTALQAAWLSSLWLITWVKLVLLTGPEWVWDKLGTAEFLEQHGQIQEKMLPVVQNCDFGG